MKYSGILRKGGVDHNSLKNTIVLNSDYQSVINHINNVWVESEQKNPIRIILGDKFDDKLNRKQKRVVRKLFQLLYLHNQLFDTDNVSERKRKIDSNDLLKKDKINSKKNRSNQSILDENAIHVSDLNPIILGEITSNDETQINKKDQEVVVQKDIVNEAVARENLHKEAWMYFCCFQNGSIVLSKEPNNLVNQIKVLPINIDSYSIKSSISNSGEQKFSEKLALDGDVSELICKMIDAKNVNLVVKYYLAVFAENWNVMLNQKRIAKGHKIDVQNGDCIRILDKNNNKLFEGVVIRREFLAKMTFSGLEQCKRQELLKLKFVEEVSKQLFIMEADSVTIEHDTFDKLKKLQKLSRIFDVLEQSIEHSVQYASRQELKENKVLNSIFYIRRGIKSRLFLKHYFQTIAKTHEYNLFHLSFSNITELIDGFLKKQHIVNNNDLNILVGSVVTVATPINSLSGDAILKAGDISTVVVDFSDNQYSGLCGITTNHQINFATNLVSNIANGNIILVEKSSLVKYNVMQYRDEYMIVILRQLLKYIQKINNNDKGLVVYLQDAELISSNQLACDILKQIGQYIATSSNMLLIVDRTEVNCDREDKSKESGSKISNISTIFFNEQYNIYSVPKSAIGANNLLIKSGSLTKFNKKDDLLSALFTTFNRFKLSDNDMQLYSDFFNSYNNLFQVNNAKIILNILMKYGNCKLAQNVNISNIFPHDGLSEEIIERVIIQGYFNRCKLNNYDHNEIILTQEDLKYGVNLLGYDIKALDNKKFTSIEKNIINMKIEPESISIGFDGIGGLDEVKKSVFENAIIPFRQNGYPSKCGLILYGPPGTGKSMLAKAIVKELNYPALVVDAPSILSKFVGMSEQFVKAIFTTLYKIKTPSVLIIDEIDTVLSARGLHHSNETNDRVKNIFLEELSRLERANDKIIIIGTTNRINALDSAFKDRRALCIEVPLPTINERAMIFRLKLEQYEIVNSDSISISEMAKLTDGYSGSDINNVCGYLLIKLRNEKIKPINEINFDSYEELQSIEYVDVHTLRQFTYKDFSDAIKEIKSSVTEVNRYSKKVVDKTSNFINTMFN